MALLKHTLDRIAWALMAALVLGAALLEGLPAGEYPEPLVEKDDWPLRYGRIDFGTLEDGTGRRADWDYDIQRLEAGAGYYLGPQVRAKAVMQFNWHAGPPGAKSDHLVGLQLASTF